MNGEIKHYTTWWSNLHTKEPFKANDWCKTTLQAGSALGIAVWSSREELANLVIIKSFFFLGIFLIIKDIKYLIIRIQQVKVSLIKRTANAAVNWVTTSSDKMMRHVPCNWVNLHTHILSCSHTMLESLHNYQTN